MQERPGENLEDLDPAIVEDDRPEPELQGDAVDAEDDVQQTDSEMGPPEDLPDESFQADPDDTLGSHDADQPEDS